MNPLPTKLLQLKHEFNRLNDEISAQINELQSIENEQTQTLNDINKKELELAGLVKELNVKLINKDVLAQRNGVVRDKFNTLDVELQEDAENVNDEKKLFLQHLGIRMHLKEVSSSVWEIKINYVDVENSKVVLHFNNQTDSFNLVSMQQEPSKIEEIRAFLKSTNDVPGFLYHCRQFFLKQSKK